VSDAPPRTRRLRRALLGALSALFALWILASGVADHVLLGRARAPAAESTSGVESPRLRTDDGPDLVARVERGR
jgi:hypothetical protein